MELSEITKKLLNAKKVKGLSFVDLGKIVSALGLGPEVIEPLTEPPTKGLGPVVPTDPLIYRLYEVMQVYGMPLKAVVLEKFGDGIMNAIDFTLGVDKEKDPNGDRVKITPLIPPDRRRIYDLFLRGGGELTSK